MVEDQTTPGTGGERMFVPSHNSNTGIVAMHTSDLSTFLDVPDLNFAGAEANTNISSITGPFDAAYICVWASLEEAANCTSFCRPNIHITFQTNGNLISRTPVKKIQVIVVNKTWSVEDALWCGSNPSSKLSRGSIGGLQRTIVLRAKVQRFRRLGWGRFEGKDASSD
jgi:hypothetical protein